MRILLIQPNELPSKQPLLRPWLLIYHNCQNVNKSRIFEITKLGKTVKNKRENENEKRKKRRNTTTWKNLNENAKNGGKSSTKAQIFVFFILFCQVGKWRFKIVQNVMNLRHKHHERPYKMIHYENWNKNRNKICKWISQKMVRRSTWKGQSLFETEIFRKIIMNLLLFFIFLPLTCR